ncbi:hypothetical protein KSX_45200 [Ktedonospora formicarum]|uniref:Uncharacterized protein n=1 Tax=Ktedonospora formicarum TaxID=2778364 RepID=A0A8J3I565_9CHLR|nr:hypothetical protein KSX_45200 [Ktedonospora formicarum]
MGVGVGVLGVEVAVGVEEGVVGVGVGDVDPLQALPFTLKLVGMGLLVVQEPLKPGLTVAFAATFPL